MASSAKARLEADQPLEALHLAEVALAEDPRSRPALQAQLAALMLLAEREGGENFQLAGWLGHRIAEVERQLKVLD